MLGPGRDVWNTRTATSELWRVTTFFNMVLTNFGAKVRALRDLGMVRSVVTGTVSVNFNGDTATSTMVAPGSLTSATPDASITPVPNFVNGGEVVKGLFNYVGNAFHHFAEGQLHSRAGRGPLSMNMSLQIDGTDGRAGVTTSANFSLSINPEPLPSESGTIPPSAPLTHGGDFPSRPPTPPGRGGRGHDGNENDDDIDLDDEDGSNPGGGSEEHEALENDPEVLFHPIPVGGGAGFFTSDPNSGS